MTDKENLIEILKASVYGNIDDGFDGPELNFENVADGLIANGVIVPPCKIGDTVYTKGHGNAKHPKEWKVVGFWISADPKCSYMHIYWYKDKDNFATRRVDFDLIGKTVFLSKEDMEQATKEG